MFSKSDQAVLKQLAQRVHDIAQLPEQQAKRDLWRRHTALKHGIPPIFVSPEGSWAEIFPDASLQCEDPFAREVELELRRRIFRHEHIPDDTPIEDHYDLPVASLWCGIPWGRGMPFCGSAAPRGRPCCTGSGSPPAGSEQVPGGSSS